MSNDRFEVESTYEAPEPKKSLGCFKGCLIVCGILFVLFLIFSFMAYKNWRKWTGSLASQAIEQSLEASKLPDQEKAEVKQELQRVIDAFQENKLTGEQMASIMTSLMQSPLMNTLIVSIVEKQYLDRSELTDDEKENGVVELNRFVSGMFQEKLHEQDFDDVIQHIATKKSDGEWELRNPDQVSDDDLRAMIATAKAKADAAEIPAEIETVDPSDEVRRIIDEALEGPLEEGAAEPIVGEPAADEPVEAAPANE